MDEKIPEWLWPRSPFLKVKFAVVLQDLNVIYGSKIEKQKAFQAVTDSMFNVSRYIVTFQLWLLLLCFIVPFIWQLFYTTNHTIRFSCCLVCLVTTVFFFVLELNQMREKGWSYWDLWNFVDISVFISFIWYFNSI